VGNLTQRDVGAVVGAFIEQHVYAVGTGGDTGGGDEAVGGPSNDVSVRDLRGVRFSVSGATGGETEFGEHKFDPRGVFSDVERGERGGESVSNLKVEVGEAVLRDVNE